MKILITVCFFFMPLSVEARSIQAALEDEAFVSAAQMFQETGRDKMAVVQAFESFLTQFSDSPRAADAAFMSGESYLEQALSVLKAESTSRKNSSERNASASPNPAATSALESARKAFQQVVGNKKSGLAPSAQYRLGEVSYDQGDWNKAVEDFKAVQDRFPKSYIVPEAFLGVIYADLALEQFSQAEANLFLLAETYPVFLNEPMVLYAKGIVALHKGDYSAAESALKAVKSAEAQYYLGKTYLLSKRAYLAAAAFENLIRDHPESDLKEEAQFFIGDSFFLAEDYDGAITKYQRFLSLYPDSKLHVCAMFRIGASYFQKKDFVQARANFQTIIDRYPQDFFAPIAQYFIAESYLVSNQMREAMFSYTRVITQYPETVKITPLAYYKLAWTSFQVGGDYAQTIETCNKFLALYPSNPLAKNVYLIMGNALIKMKHLQEATAALQRIVDMAPASDIAEQALFSILQTQFNQKAFDMILTSYQFIFRHLPPSRSKWRSLSYLYAAEAYLGLNQIDEAKSIYDMVLKVYPDEAAAFYAQDGLAWAYAYKGEDDKALEARQKLKAMLSAVSSTYSFSGINELGIADSLFNQKSYDDAYQLYIKFVDNNAKAAEAPAVLYKAAMCLYHQHYYTQAIETWQRLQARYPQAPETAVAVFQAADTLFRAPKYPEAIAAYRDIIANYPTNPQLPMASLRIAQAYFNAHDDAEALKQVRELIAKHPKASEVGDAMELVEGVFDRSPQSNFKAFFRDIVASNVSTLAAGEAQFRMARRCFESKDFAGAAAEFQKFSVDFTNHPQVAKAQFLLGESYFNLNDYAHASPAYERLLNNFDKSDDTPLALFHLASSSFALKKYDDAVKYYGRLIDEYPKLDYIKETQFNLALTYKAMGKSDLAQYSYQKYIGMVPEKDPMVLSALWEIFALQKDRRDYDGALGTLQRIQESVQPGSDTVLEAIYRMAEVYGTMNRPDEAQNCWERLRAMKPANNPFRIDSLIKLGEAYEKAQDLDRAVAVYEDLARNAPKDIAQSAAARAAALRGGRPAKQPVSGRKAVRESPVPAAPQKQQNKKTDLPGMSESENP